MGQVVFTNTALKSTQKQGKLTPDADGYYELVLGGLNTFNSGGQYYQLNGAEHLFEQSSIFMRRVNDGCLYAELGHPTKPMGASVRDWILRVLRIDEKNVVAHIKEIRLTDNEVKDESGQFVLAIVGKVKPFGPHAKVLADALTNACQNVCFSIRSLTEDVQQGGVVYKTLKTIVTFDMVIEPGIAYAKKWFAPSLEAFKDTFILTKEMLSSFMSSSSPVATESVVSLETISTELGWQTPKASKSKMLEW